MPRNVIDPTIHVGMRIFNSTNYDTVVERVAYGGVSVIAFGPNRMASQEMVAYKTLRQELIADPQVRSDFIRECLLWRGLWPHPNIAVAYEAFTMDVATGQRIFLALAYAEHGNLRELFQASAKRSAGGQMPLELALHVAQQIAAGLAYLHQPDPNFMRNEPIVHRDLKPENVLLMDDGRAVITDFGLAKVVEKSSTALALVLGDGASGQPLQPGQLGEESVLLVDDAATQTTRVPTAHGVVVGTPPYMPPEQWDDSRHVGPKADIYALGIMLSELFTGRHALLDLNQPHSQADWQRAHLTSQPRPLRNMAPDVPASIEAIYQICLAHDPEDRPSALEVFAALQAGARAAGVEVYTPPEFVRHSPYNEFVQWTVWSDAYFGFSLFADALVRNDRALVLARHLQNERPDLLSATLLTRGAILKELGSQALVAGKIAEAAEWDHQAEAAYEESLATRPRPSTPEGSRGRAFVWLQIGVFNSERKRYAYAEDAYARAISLVPGISETYFRRADNQREWGLAEAGNQALAIAHLRQARVHAVTALALGDPDAQRLIQEIEAELWKLGVTDDESGSP